MDKKYINPYYAYIELSIGDFTINNIDNGAINLNATYKTDSHCDFVIELFDDTAHQLAEAILEKGRNVIVSYGYAGNDDHIIPRSCIITNIHTEIVGTGEIMNLELLPESLEKVLLSVNENHTSATKYEGTPSFVLRRVIREIGWSEGIIVDTKPLKGTNNGNDNLDDLQDYYYWDSNIPVTEFMNSLTKNAVSLDDKKDFKLYTDYSTDPPTVNFYPSEDVPGEEHLEWIYGREETEIISLSVDWGDALLAHVGLLGSQVVNQDDTSNLVKTTEQSSGYESQVEEGVSKILEEYTGQKLNSKNGTIIGPQGKETYYGTLKPSSQAFTYTINENPGKGMGAWNIYYRNDGVLMWGEYVVVAADISGTYGEEGVPGQRGYYPALPNHQGKFNRGDIVETSLGKGIVVDACRAACDYPSDMFDIAVDTTTFRNNNSQIEQDTRVKDDLSTESARGESRKLKDEKVKATIKTNGSQSQEKAEIEEANRVAEVFDCSYEASLTLKGRTDIDVMNKIYLTIYCKDGTLHFASGEYLILEKVDTIEGDFTTNLKLQKISGDISVNGYVYDSSLVYSGLSSAYSTPGVHVPIIKGNATGVNVVFEAKQYIGNPYVWGGSSLETGCDCSHFVWLVLKNCGYDYGYRTSAYWRNVGDPVAPADVKPGDVLCYNGHVAFYVDSTHIVHARGRKYGIEVTECDPLKYHGGVLTIRRVVADKRIPDKPNNEEDR